MDAEFFKSKTGRKIIICGVLGLLGLLLCWYLHIFQTPKDKKLQEAMHKDLVETGMFDPGKWVSDADVICIIPPYHDASQLETTMSQAARNALDLRINSFIGNQDDHWWLVGFQHGELKHLYKIQRGTTHFPVNDAPCVQLDGVLFQRHGNVSKNGHALFVILRKEK